MTVVLVVNIVLAAIVFAAVMAIAAFAIRGSHREGRPVEVASRRRWVRPTIALHGPTHQHARRPFELELDS